MTQTFTRMDKSTAEEWMQIGVESARSQQHQGETVLQLLKMLSTKVDGFAVDQLTWTFVDMTNDGGRMAIMWGKTMGSAAFKASAAP